MKVAVAVCYSKSWYGKPPCVAGVYVFTCEGALETFLGSTIYDDVEVYRTDTIGLGEKAE